MGAVDYFCDDCNKCIKPLVAEAQNHIFGQYECPKCHSANISTEWNEQYDAEYNADEDLQDCEINE